MNKKIFFSALFIFAATLFLCGCPLKVTVNCDKNDKLSINFSSQLGTAFVENLTQIQQISDENGENSANLDEIAKKIQSELNASFFQNASVNIDQKSLSAGAQVPSLKKFPKEFIDIKKQSNGKKTFALTLNPETLAASILQEDSAAKTLADILMAPIISGEEMSLDEYKDLLTEIYGGRLASELLSGDLVVEFVANGQKQVQRVSVSDLLLSASGKQFAFEY
ncbi:MAG: hypothetical protein IJS51_05955 [Treponema sp.]|nr:hypothetical protein [Treponema sp.]